MRLTTYGYIRVSTKDQNEDRQKIALLEAGVIERKINSVKLLEEMKKRVIAECGEGITVYAKFRDWKQYYPLTKSLKVDKMALKQEGFNDAILIL